MSYVNKQKKSTENRTNGRHAILVWLLALLFSVGQGIVGSAVHAQSQTAKGTVVSKSDGMPLPGVSVLVKGTTIGTVTDFDGNYSLTVGNGQTLVFSFLGFRNQEVVFTGAPINVTLEEEASELDDVVVIGYGVQKKALVTGATAQVQGEDIAKLNTTNPLQAMQGQTAGVSISSTSGQPGSDMKVQIRGLGTVGNSAPLYLIDGIGGDITTINPADIESINVLKDAASAAIYGAQAANGVVLVTTKSGKEGRSEVSIDAYKGWQSAARKAKLLNSHEYMTIMDEEQVNSGAQPYDWTQFKSIYDADGKLIDTDWVDAMFKDNADIQSYTLSMTGGGKTSTYAMSGGYMSQEGIVGGSDVSNYERYNFRINSEHKLFDKLLKVGEQASFVYTVSRGVGVGNQYNTPCAELSPHRRSRPSTATTCATAAASTPPTRATGTSMTATHMAS